MIIKDETVKDFPLDAKNSQGYPLMPLLFIELDVLTSVAWPKTERKNEWMNSWEIERLERRIKVTLVYVENSKYQKHYLN